MYTMPVAFRLQPVNKPRYTVKPQSGIIPPLTTLTLEIIYHLPPGLTLPDSFPNCDDSFLLHSVVVPGAAIKDASSTLDTVPNEWFTARRKQVFIDSGMKVVFVGSLVLSRLVMDGAMDEIREVLERSNPEWDAADSVDSDGHTLLHIAVLQSRPDIVQLLMEFEADIELQNRSGSTAIESAAAAGETLIVELLLAHKASTERSSCSNWGPIHLAVAGGHLDVLKLLLKKANIDALTKDGNSALHIAVEERKKDCVRLLLSSGANPDVGDSNNRDTPLHIAAVLGDEHMVKLLLQKGANKEIRNKLGKTAYDVAAGYGHSRLYDALKLGDRLCIASSKGEARMIVRLIENGALINGRDQNGWTALHRASFKGKLEVVRVLVDKGIDINARDEEGYTALHCAVEAGEAQVVELLVKREVDTEARTGKGVTALQIAESLQYVGISRILVHGGAMKSDDIGMEKIVAAPFRKGKLESKEPGVKRRPGSRRSSRGSIDRSSVAVKKVWSEIDVLI